MLTQLSSRDICPTIGLLLDQRPCFVCAFAASWLDIERLGCLIFVMCSHFVYVQNRSLDATTIVNGSVQHLGYCNRLRPSVMLSPPKPVKFNV